MRPQKSDTKATAVGGKLLPHHKHPSILDSPDSKRFVVVFVHLILKQAEGEMTDLTGVLTPKCC